MATKLRLFLDASVIIAGIASLTGASGIILSLCEAGQVQAIVSEAVLDECQRNIQRKLPEVMPRFQRVMKALKLEIVPYYALSGSVTRELKGNQRCCPKNAGHGPARSFY